MAPPHPQPPHTPPPQQPPSHVCFITSSSVVIYGSRRDHFSGLFISPEDKRKSWVYYPDGVGLFTQQRASSGSCNIPASTYLICLFGGIKLHECANLPLPTRWICVKYKMVSAGIQIILLSLLVVLLSGHLVLMACSFARVIKTIFPVKKEKRNSLCFHRHNYCRRMRSGCREIQDQGCI